MTKKRKIIIGFLLMIAVLAGIYIYAHFDPVEYGFFPKCPVYVLTGYKCPGCGSQRAFHSLFQGNFREAFRYNPFMFFLVPYILSGIFIEYIAKPTDVVTIRLRTVFFGKRAAFVLAFLIILYTFLRNI